MLDHAVGCGKVCVRVFMGFTPTIWNICWYATFVCIVLLQVDYSLVEYCRLDRRQISLLFFGHIFCVCFLVWGFCPFRTWLRYDFWLYCPCLYSLFRWRVAIWVAVYSLGCGRWWRLDLLICYVVHSCFTKRQSACSRLSPKRKECTYFFVCLTTRQCGQWFFMLGVGPYGLWERVCACFYGFTSTIWESSWYAMLICIVSLQTYYFWWWLFSVRWTTCLRENRGTHNSQLLRSWLPNVDCHIVEAKCDVDGWLR